MDCHVIFQILPHGIGIRFPIATIQQRHYSLKGACVNLIHAKHILIAEAIFLFPCSIKKLLLKLRLHILPRCIKGSPIGLTNRTHLAHGIGFWIIGKRYNKALSQTQSSIRHYQVYIKLAMASKTAASRTGTKRIVEGKHAGSNFRQTDTAVNTGKILAEHKHFPIHYLNIGHALTQL